MNEPKNAAKPVRIPRISPMPDRDLAEHDQRREPVTTAPLSSSVSMNVRYQS